MQENRNDRKRATGPRFVLIIMLLIVALGCALGFLATFEPGDAKVMWAFRGPYAVVGLVAGSSAVRLLAITRCRK